MALVSCNACGVERAVGFMPAASCGLALIPALAGAILSAVFGWRSYGAWVLLLPVPVFAAILAALHYVPWTFEYLLVVRRPCPSCGERGCSFPYTKGSGL